MTGKAIEAEVVPNPKVDKKAKPVEELQMLVENAISLEDITLISTLINNSTIEKNVYENINKILKLDEKFKKIVQYLNEKKNGK